MNEQTIEYRVIGLIAEHMGLEERPSPDANMRDDLGADNLDKIELAIGIEEEFNCEISDDDLDECETVGQIVALVERLAAEQA